MRNNRVLLAIVFITGINGAIGSAIASPVAAEPTEKVTAASSSDEFNKNMSLLGGGVLGLLVASGVAGLLSAGSMMYEGGAFGEAMEAGAGLTLPVTFLAAVLGAVFAQDTATSLINAGSKEIAKLTAH